jgi:hypothetical protein
LRKRATLQRNTVVHLNKSDWLMITAISAVTNSSIFANIVMNCPNDARPQAHRLSKKLLNTTARILELLPRFAKKRRFGPANLKMT